MKKVYFYIYFCMSINNINDYQKLLSIGYQPKGNIYDENSFDNRISKSSPMWQANNWFSGNYLDKKSEYYFKYGIELIPQSVDEDPVILGFDLSIDSNSPLFTELPAFFDFADQNGLTEISSKRTLYNDFITQLSLFFNNNSQDIEFNAFKSHYITNITGLNNLVESSTKQFNKYGDDALDISFREDVKLNAAYLMNAYKTLTWSKVRGKELIPINLLRFNMNIKISEMRNFSKIIKAAVEVPSAPPTQAQRIQNGIPNPKAKVNDVEEPENAPIEYRDVLSVIVDNIANWNYTVYDCSFQFDTPFHKDTISNKDATYLDESDIRIIYKFSTMRFETFRESFEQMGQSFVTTDSESIILNNLNFNNVKSDENIAQDSSLNSPELRTATTPKEPYETLDKTVNREKEKNRNKGLISNLVDTENNNFLQKNKAFKALTDSGLSAADAVAVFGINRLETARNGLINDALQKFRKATGFSRINAPLNVYATGDNESDIITQIRNFALNTGQNFLNAGFTNLVVGGVNNALNNLPNPFQ